MRLVVVSACVLASLLAAPGSASAAKVELVDEAGGGSRVLTYTAGADERNNVLLWHSSSVFIWEIYDTGKPPIERIAPCEVLAPYSPHEHDSKCPDEGVTSLRVDLGDRDDIGNLDQPTLFDVPVIAFGGPGNDELSLHSEPGGTLDGGPGNDRITAAANSSGTLRGKDTVIGGDGDDTVNVDDGVRDVVSCGSGTDTVKADNLDEVGADCETVERPAPTPGPTTPPPGPTTPISLRADGLPVGVTINDGARFTNAPDVVLTALAPDAATGLRIANDGGFGAFFQTARNPFERYSFRLDSSGPERLPKTVYVRFDGAGGDAQNFTDDIILDETAPALLSARAAGRTLRLRASDATSGVATLQTARNRKRPARPRAYRSRMRVSGSPRWVRVADRAGNLSRWRRVAR